MPARDYTMKEIAKVLKITPEPWPSINTQHDEATRHVHPAPNWVSSP